MNAWWCDQLYRLCPVDEHGNLACDCVDEGIGDYYDRKDADARRIRKELRDLEESIKEGLNPEIAAKIRRRLEHQLEMAEYVGD